MRILTLVGFALVVCAQFVATQELGSFEEIFEYGYTGTLDGSSALATKHGGGRGRGRGRGGRPFRRRSSSRRRPRPGRGPPFPDTDSSDSDEGTSGNRPTPIPSTTSAPEPIPNPVQDNCTQISCNFYKARCDIFTNTISGTIRFAVQKTFPGGEPPPLRIGYNLTGIIPAGIEHGMHIHTSGANVSGTECGAAGEHYNPLNQNHGVPETSASHVGDLGNVQVEVDGSAEGSLQSTVIKLPRDPLLGSVIGRSVLVSIGKDDLGAGGSPISLATGNSGPALGCCQIYPVYWPGEIEWYKGFNDPDN